MPGAQGASSVRPARGAPTPATELVRGLIERLKRPTEIPRVNRVYANRNLRMDRVGVVGFDMDYTLALYHQSKMEEISIRVTVDKLVVNKGYPADVRALPYDPALAIRGLVIDRQLGNILKPDRYGAPGRAYHGRTPIERGKILELYQRERTRLSSRRYAFIDTLFALPEAVLYAYLVEYFDARPDPKPDYNQLWQDIRECIDLAHRDGSIKTIIAAELPVYIERDPFLAEALHKLRSSGKRLFLLTNSDFQYTNPVMSYLLDGAFPAYPSWRNFFDVVIVSAGKPEFFTESRPFVEIDPLTGEAFARPCEGPFQRNRVYAAGNLKDFEERAGARGDQVLFVGDHIYGDMLRSRKSSAWRTAMVIQELEHEVTVHDKHVADLGRLDELDRQLRHLDSEIEEKQILLRTLQRLADADEHAAELLEGRKVAKELVDKLRTELRGAVARHTAIEQDLDVAFNPYWGPLFREGHEVSKFGDQVEDYACVYTSRVSNFRFYSPMRHFRGPRDRMPHER
jgi:5'-nucleotidase